MGAATPCFQKCPLEGKTPLSLRESGRIWLGFHDDSNNNKKISSVVQKQGERQNSSWLHTNFLPLLRPAPAFPPGLLLLPQPLPSPSAQPTNLLQEYAKNPSVWRSWGWLPHPQKSRQCSEQAPGAMGQRAGLEWQTGEREQGGGCDEPQSNSRSPVPAATWGTPGGLGHGSRKGMSSQAQPFLPWVELPFSWLQPWGLCR